MSQTNRSSVRSVRRLRALPLAYLQSAFRSPKISMSSVFHRRSTAAWTSSSASISSTAVSGSVWTPISTSCGKSVTVQTNCTVKKRFLYCACYLWITQVAAWCSGQRVGLNQRSYCTSGPVTTCMGDCLRTGKPSQYDMAIQVNSAFYLHGTVKWISAFEVSSNKWLWCMQTL